MNKRLIKSIPYFGFLIFLPFKSFSQDSSFVSFTFNADSAYLVVDKQYTDAVKISNGDSVLILHGQHILNLSTYYDKAPVKKIFIAGSGLTLDFEFNEPETASINSLSDNFAAKQDLRIDALIFTDSDSEIFLNDQFVGRERIGLNFNQEINVLRIENPNFGSKEIDLNNEPFLQVIQPYKRPIRSIAQTASLLPGFSQGYKRQYLKGGAFLLGNLLSLNYYMNAADEYSLEKDRFDALVEEYATIRNENDALELGNEIEALRGEIRDLDSRKNLFLGTTLGLYALNLFDAFISKPRGGYRTNNFHIEFEVDNEARVRFNF